MSYAGGLRSGRAGAPAEMVFPLRGRDGALRPFHTRVIPVRDGAGRITRWFGINTDVSAQSETEARLRASEEQWREVFERAGDGDLHHRRRGPAGRRQRGRLRHGPALPR